MSEEFSDIKKAYAVQVRRYLEKRTRAHVSCSISDDSIIAEFDNTSNGYYRVVVKNVTNLLHYGLPASEVGKRAIAEYKELILSKFFKY